MATPRLLVTSFNDSGYNMAEAAKAKAAALASTLIGTDRTDEMWASTPAGFFSKPKQGGIEKVTYSGGTKLFGFLALTERNYPGWERLHREFPKEFPDWLQKHFAEPVSCWYLSGHHHLNKHYNAMSWGTHYKTLEGGYRPFVGLGIDTSTNVLEFFGYRKDSDVPRDVRLEGAKANLQGLSLFIIGGCNGIPRKVGGALHFSEMAQAWRDYLRKQDGSAPLILGWFNTHELPKDEMGDSAADLFWPDTKRLAQNHATDLAGLCKNHVSKVIQAWGHACFKAFENSVKRVGNKKIDQRHLWHIKWKGNDSKGAGAIAPNGDVYNADPTYTGSAGTAAMTKVGTLV